VLLVDKVCSQVDSTVNDAVCLKGFEDRRMRPSGVSSCSESVRLVRIVIGSLTTRLNVPVVRSRLDFSSSDLTK